MTLKLGPQTEPLNVEVSRGGIWWSSFHNVEGDWPDGVSIELRFEFEDLDPIIWVATIVDDMATWLVSEADVDDLLDLEPRIVSLWYMEPSLGYLPWAKGSVQIK